MIQQGMPPVQNVQRPGGPAAGAMGAPQQGQVPAMGGQAQVMRPGMQIAQPPGAPSAQMGMAQAPTAAGAMTPQVQAPMQGAQPAQAVVRNMMMSAPGQNMQAAPAPAGPSYGQPWQPGGGGPAGGGWQPPWQQFGGGMGMPQGPPPMPMPAQPQQSVMQQAMASGQSNPQQTQNFLHALQQSGAGSNNSYMSSGAQPQQQAQQLIGAPAQDDGGYGQTSYAGGYNQGMGGVSYNGGLAARPNQGGTALDPQGNQFYQGTAPQTQWSQPGNVSYPPASAQSPARQAQAGQIAQRGPANPALTAMSDERAKEEVLPGAEKTRDFLSHLNAWEYEYKDPKHGEGRFVSPMAQELEKTAVGKSAVIETPEGKMVDYSRLAGVQLAAAADFHRRLMALENK